MESLLQYIDIAICAENFKAFNNPEYEILDCFKSLNIKEVAVTHNQHAIEYYEDNKKCFIDVPKIKAVDTLGAGDVFHGAFCYYYQKENNFRKALEQASEVAAHSCKFFGSKTWIKESKMKF